MPSATFSTLRSTRRPTLHSIALPLLVALAVGGCASVAPPAPHGPAVTPTPADQRAAAPAALAGEARWLQSWFRGTPVRIVQRNDGAVSVDVPLEFCFDPGHSSVKPALAALLDKVSESMRRVPQARMPLLAAPDDATGTTPLGLQRALQVRAHLLSRGVPAANLGKPGVTAAAAVQLRLEVTSP